MRSAVRVTGGAETIVWRGRNQFEVLLGMGQRVVRHQRRHVSQFSGLGAKEFAPGGSVEEQIGDGERGAAGQRSVFHAKNLAAGNLHAGTRGLFARRRLQRDARHRSDGRQRLAAEAQGGDREQIVRSAQFRGGVTLEGQQRIVAIHALAVVGDADQLAPPAFHLDADARRLRRPARFPATP